MLPIPLRQFYLDCCAKTSGWFPVEPKGEPISPGDFGPVKNGSVAPLGNLFQMKMVDDIEITDPPISFGRPDWRLSSGVRASQETAQFDEGGEVGLWRSQHLRFREPGSYLLCGINPRAAFIANWSRIQDEVTLKLTISKYSFRQVWVVTDVLYFDRWGLAVAESDQAELDLSVRYEGVDTGFDHLSMLSHQASQMRRSQGLSVLERGSDERSLFFKAKKLVLTQRVRDRLLGDMMREAADGFNRISAWMKSDLTSRLDYSAVNPNSCLETFTWTDATIDDLIKT